MENFFLSFLAMFFWSSVLAIFLHWNRRRKSDIKRLGVTWISAIYILLFLRMLFPFDVGIGKAISMPEFFNDFYSVVNLDEYFVMGIPVTIVDILGLVWISIGAYKVVRFGVQYYKVVRLYDVGELVDTTGMEAFGEVEEIISRKMEVRLLKTDFVEVPMAMGVLKKTILLPNKEYSASQLYNILLHEMMHFCNHDLQIKLVARICCCVFWWNPLSYIMVKDLDQVLEIRCDSAVTKAMNNAEKAVYLKTIVAVMQSATPQKLPRNSTVAALVESADVRNINERFEMVSQMQKSKSRRTLSTSIIVMISLLLYIMSYRFIPMPSYQPPQEEITEGKWTEVTPENGYLLQDKNGTFYLVVEEEGVKEEIEDEILVEWYEDSGFELKKE